MRKTRTSSRRQQKAARRLGASKRPRKLSYRQATDRAGRRVVVGTRVRVLEVDVALKTRIPADEWQELQAMVGGTFSVYEIDEHGSAWVETPLLPHVDGSTYSHSLALDAHEMEVVSESRRRPTRG